MNDIYSLLNINEDVLTNFHLQANSVADHQTEKVIIANTRRLKEIEERMLTDCQVKFTARSVDEVMQKVIRYAYNRGSENEEWTSAELRIISYYIMKLQGDDVAYMYGLSLLDDNWKDTYFNGLVFYVLNGWNLMKIEYREMACELINRKLKAYDGKNKKYILLKNHSNFFENAGPYRMASLLKLRGISLYDAPKLIGYKPSTINLSFYSDVIVKMLSGKQFTDPDMIQELFSKHVVDRTKKLVFANYVEEADDNGDAHLQSQLSKCASQILGDISKSVTWTPFAGATEAEISKLRKAKDLVNQWYVRKVIEVFFEVCVQDHSRKVFWLEYANQGLIKDFRIAGSTLVRQTMQNDERISNLFSRYYINTNSRYSQTAALVLYIKNKVMVEFSDTGALYVYNRGNSMVSFIDKGKSSIGSVSDLKQTSLPLLVEDNYYSYTYYEEGRHNHRGEWQRRLRLWMQRYLFNSSYQTESFSNDDKIFVPQPLPSQSPAPEYREENIVETRHEEILAKQQVLNFEENSNYETNLNFRLASKWIFGKFRIVGSSKGFYINIGKRFYPVKDIEESDKLEGSIWVKHPKNRWFNVVHYNGVDTFNIGYVKVDLTNLLYKDKESDQSCKIIKL